MKKTRYLALLLLGAFLFQGCNLIRVNPERDGAQVVATVGGENITKKEVYDAGAGYPYYFNWNRKIESWEVSDTQTQKEQVLEGMIQQKVVMQQAKAKGFYTFTADEQKQIDDYVSTVTKTTYDEALKKYQDAAKTDPAIKPEEKANADVDAYLASLGYTRDKLKQEQSDSIAYGKLEKSVTDPVNPTDADVKAEYDKLTASQKTAYDATPAQAVSDDSNGTVVVYYPNDGFIRVRQILIPLPSDIQTQISTDRTTNTKESNAAADKLRADELKKIEATANDWLTKAKAAGGDVAKLDQLIKDSGNNDPGMDSKPEGYLVCKDAPGYVKEFTDASMALTTVGLPSGLVGTDFGYHIIWITSKVPQGNVPYDQIKAKLTETVKSTQQSTAWQNAVTGWMGEYKTKITKYTSRLNN